MATVAAEEVDFQWWVLVEEGQHACMKRERRLTLDNDIVSENREHRAKCGVDQEQEECEYCHGLLRAHDGVELVGLFGALNEDCEQNKHLLCHDKDYTQEKADGKGGLELAHNDRAHNRNEDEQNCSPDSSKTCCLSAPVI